MMSNRVIMWSDHSERGLAGARHPAAGGAGEVRGGGRRRRRGCGHHGRARARAKREEVRTKNLFKHVNIRTRTRERFTRTVQSMILINYLRPAISPARW